MSSIAEELLRRVSDAIVALDRDWRYTYVNEQAGALFGRSPEDLLGKHIWTEFPEGVGQPFHVAYERAVAEQKPVSFEDYYAPWDRWFENQVFPSADGVTIFFHEITDRKRIERAERDANELNRQVIDSAHEGIAVFDRELRYVRVNPALAATMGLPAAAISGKRPRELLPDDNARAIEQRLERVIAGEVVETRDFRVARLDTGRPAWVSSLLSPLRAADGTIIGVLAFIRDVTDHVRAEEAIAESEERLRLALEGARAGIWDWDLTTNVIVWSRGHEELWGIVEGGFNGTYEEFVAPVRREDRPELERCVQAALANKTDFAAEFRVRQPGGGERWIKSHGRVLDVDGRARMLGTVVDVSERKRAELALEVQTKVLGIVAAGASIDESLSELAHGIEAIVPEFQCSVLLLDPGRERISHVAAPSLPADYVAAIDGQPIGPAAGSCGTAAFLGEPVHVEDIATDSRWRDYRELALHAGLRSCWSTPLFDSARRAIGTFALYGRSPGLPRPWQLELIASATHVAEVAFESDRGRRELAASERRYHDLYEHAPDIYLSVDLRDRAVVACNATLSQVTGFAREEVLGYDVIEIFEPASVEAAKLLYAELATTGEVLDRTLRIRRKHGDGIDISINASAERDASGAATRSRSIWRDITRRLRAENDLRRLSARVLRSQDDERRRIARELHDTTGQNLAALAMNLALVQRRASPDLAELLEECVTLTTRSAAELRTLSYVLHPPMLEDFGLERAIRELAEGLERRSGLEVTVDAPEPIGRFAPDRELALFRVAQESLANVGRHSTSQSAHLRLTRDRDQIVLEVRNGGRPRRDGEPPVGVGIAGMRERLRQLGGRLEVAFGEETVVRALAPIEETA